MYDKDDDIIENNVNGNDSEMQAPCNFTDNFSSPYDSITDLEKEIEREQDSEGNSAQAPISQFNIKKHESNNIIFLSAAILVFIMIVGVVFAINKDYIKLPQSVSAIFNKQQKVIEENVVENPEADKRTVNISTMDENEVARILDEDNKDGTLPDLPPMAQNGQIPIENDIIVARVPSGNVGRMDPFNPVGSNSYYDVMVPPTSVTQDTDAQSLMNAKITGILYTSDSPSAIVNIAGSDQLVRPGDKIEGFKIVRITKDKVTIQTGKNVYAASVGELVSADAVGIRDVPNFKKKFAGPYSGGGRIIEINSTN